MNHGACSVWCTSIISVVGGLCGRHSSSQESNVQSASGRRNSLLAFAIDRGLDLDPMTF